MNIKILGIEDSIGLRKGNVLGGILLLSGSCIGVGMLALPALTAFAGFLPTSIVFIFCWLFMTTTALLLVEANMWYEDKPNLVTLSYRILGQPGRICTWISFLFLFYSLIVAYIVKGGELIQHGMEVYFSFLIPSWMGASLITVFSALIIYSGTWFVDYFNRLAMLGLFITYFFLLFVGMDHFDDQLLTHVNWQYSLFVVPFIVTSFGFHNMIPTLNEYLAGDRKKLLITIVLGGLIPFFVFLLWILKVQSIVPLEGEISLSQSFAKGEISTETLSILLKSSWISFLVAYFAFFAILTSLFGQALSVFDFLSDGLQIPKNSQGRMILCFLTFFPTYLFSQLFPNVFFLILELVGGVAVMILFGLLPVMMVWKGRYKMNLKLAPIVPGGKPFLILIATLATTILSYEFIKHLW
jgi:tyrosine-specific transport protein